MSEPSNDQRQLTGKIQNMRIWKSLRGLMLGYFSDPLQNCLSITQSAIGAFSITKTVLSMHRRIEPGENGGDDGGDGSDNFAELLPLMEGLCKELDIPPVGLADYREILKLWDRSGTPDAAVSFAEVERARGLSARYVNWVYDIFPGFQRTLKPGHALLKLGTGQDHADDSFDSQGDIPEVSASNSADAVSGSALPDGKGVARDAGDDRSQRNQKPRSVDVIVNAAALWLVTVGLLWIAPGLEPSFQIIAAITAAYAVIAGTLLFVRFRWSPELVLTFYIAAAGWTAYVITARGTHALNLSALAIQLYMIWTYRTLRRDVRG